VPGRKVFVARPRSRLGATLDANRSLVEALSQSNEYENALQLANQTLLQIEKLVVDEGEVAHIRVLRDRIRGRRIVCLNSLERKDELILAWEERCPWLLNLSLETLPGNATDLQHASQYVAALRSMEKSNKALQWQKKIYAAQKNISGERNTKTLGNLYRLTNSIKDYEGHVSSLPYAKELVDLASDVLGPTHPNTLVAKSNYANSLKNVGQYAWALLRFQELQKHYHKLGKHNPSTLVVETKLAGVMQSLRQSDEALKLIDSVVDRALDHPTMGKSSTTTLIALYQLSLFQIDGGQLEAAIETIETEIGILKDAGREEQTTTKGDIRWRLQLAYMKQGELEIALKQREYFSGEVTNKTIKESVQTAEILIDLERFDEATHLLEEILLLENGPFDTPPELEQLRAHQDHTKGLLSATLQAKDPQRALKLLIEAVDGLFGRNVWLQNVHVRDPLKRHGDALIALYESSGDADKAEALRSKLAEFERANQEAREVAQPSS